MIERFILLALANVIVVGAVAWFVVVRFTRGARRRAAAQHDAMAEIAIRLNRAVDAAGRASEDVNALSQRTGEIHDIVGTMGQIAEKTHLLSVNASIEAARAGEAGRGFGVVAEEIRRLADSSARSADRIAEIVAGIDDHSRRVVATMEASSTALSESLDHQLALAESMVEDGGKR